MLQIDKIAYSNKLTALNPTIKFMIGIMLLILAIVLENIPFYVLITFGVGMIITCYGRINFKKYIKLFLIPSSFLLISIISIILSVSSSSDVFLFAIPLGNLFLGITNEAIVNCGYLFFRALACLSATYFIALTLPMNQLIYVLKQFKTPKVVIEMIMLMYRFIMMFLEEFKEMQTAIYLKFGYGSIKIHYRSISLLITSLFTRMMGRYEELSISLEVKLYDGEFHI